MANHNSTKKSCRKIKRRTFINKSRFRRIKTFIKKVEELIKSGSDGQALEMFKITQSEIMRGVAKGVLKLNNASNKVSKLACKIKNVVKEL